MAETSTQVIMEGLILAISPIQPDFAGAFFRISHILTKHKKSSIIQTSVYHTNSMVRMRF